MAKQERKENFVVTFSTNDFEKLKAKYPNFVYNYSNFHQWAKSFIDDIKATAGNFCKVSAKRTTGSKKTIYLLFEEKNWNCEEYTDVICAFENKEDALRALLNYRNDFVQEHEEEWKEAKENPDYWTIQDTPEHFQLLDEGMGENYELMIKEQELV